MTVMLEPKGKLDAMTTQTAEPVVPETAVVAVVNGPEGSPVDWHSIAWRGADRNVQRLRQRIFTASQQGDLAKVRNLQKLMLRSRSNALVSVRRVTQLNAGRLTAGIDGKVVVAPEDKAELADWVQTRAMPWKPKAVKRVYVPKRNGKRRPIGIPVIADRCLQALTLNALEPEWEARLDPRVYGFRPGRGCHDAIVAIHTTARGKNAQRLWALDADLEAAFDRLDHHHLLQSLGTFPARATVAGWLKAGVVENGWFTPTEQGSPQGGLCSAEHNDPNAQCWVMRSVGRSGLVEVGCGGRTLRITRGGFWSRFGHGAGSRRLGATDKLLEWNQNPDWFADLELHD